MPPKKSKGERKHETKSETKSDYTYPARATKSSESASYLAKDNPKLSGNFIDYASKLRANFRSLKPQHYSEKASLLVVYGCILRKIQMLVNSDQVFVPNVQLTGKEQKNAIQLKTLLTNFEKLCHTTSEQTEAPKSFRSGISDLIDHNIKKFNHDLSLNASLALPVSGAGYESKGSTPPTPAPDKKVEIEAKLRAEGKLDGKNDDEIEKLILEHSSLGGMSVAELSKIVEARARDNQLLKAEEQRHLMEKMREGSLEDFYKLHVLEVNKVFQNKNSGYHKLTDPYRYSDENRNSILHTQKKPLASQIEFAKARVGKVEKEEEERARLQRKREKKIEKNNIAKQFANRMAAKIQEPNIPIVPTKESFIETRLTKEDELEISAKRALANMFR